MDLLSQYTVWRRFRGRDRGLPLGRFCTLVVRNGQRRGTEGRFCTLVVRNGQREGAEGRFCPYIGENVSIISGNGGVKIKKKALQQSAGPFGVVLGRIELPTHGFSVHCSTI